MDRKNKGLIVLVIILTILVLGLGGYIVYDKVLSKNNDTNINNNDNDINNNNTDINNNVSNNNDNNSNNDNILDNDENGNKSEIITKDELFSLLEGYWYYKSGKYLVAFGDNTFGACVYQTDGGISGNINSANMVDDKIYQLNIYNAGCNANDCIDEIEPYNHSILVDIKDISSKIIYVKLFEDGDFIKFDYLEKDATKAYEILDQM